MKPSASSLAASPPAPPEPRARRPFGWRAWRDRLLASARFRRLATAFPLTRPIARRRARALFDLCAGFVYSQTLLACVRLDLFAFVADGPKRVGVVAARAGLTQDSARRLLDAAAALRLLERRGPDSYGLGALGAALLGDPGLAAMIEHHSLFYEDMADPVALLRGQTRTRLGALWPYARGPVPDGLAGEQVAAYSALMAASQPMVAAEILAAYDVRRHRRLLDIGGGDGVFLRAAARAAPSLDLALFDLPAVAARARALLAADGVEAACFGGDIRAGGPSGGFDLVSLVRVVHDHDDELALVFLRAAFDALESGGTLLLAEPMAGARGAETVGDAYFGFYLLAMGSGRARTPAVLADLLAAAGFSAVRVVPTRMPLVTGLIVARRPSVKNM